MIKFWLNFALSVLVLVLGGWAANQQVAITKLQDDQAKVAALHEEIAVVREDLTYIKAQLSDLKNALDDHNARYHNK